MYLNLLVLVCVPLAGILVSLAFASVLPVPSLDQLDYH